jgi:His/Glu/Gln/Arg/opine family amino acid ABC transporter permease subunit
MDVLLQNLPYLMKGAVQTIWMSLLAVVFGTLLGLCLGFAAVSRFRTLRAVIDTYIFLIRGIPVLILMLGYRISNYAAVTIALVIYAGAFYTDVVRGALQAVPRGQTEAAKSLGIPRKWIVLDILLPQAIKPSIPPWLNISIVTVKSTSYAAIVGAWELTYASKEIVERTLATFEIFSAVMLFYFVICYPLSLLSRRLEKQSVVVN